MNRFAVLFLSTFLLWACAEEPAPSPVTAPDPAAVEEAAAPAEPTAMLPAYKLPGDFKPGKADQYSDYKDANPSVYGITNPPAVGVRPVAEYEPAARLMITVSSTSLPSGILANLADIVKYGKQVSDLYVLYDSNAIKSSFTSILSQHGVSASGFNWLKMDLDSIWVRDFGPLPIVSNSGKVGIVDLRYYHQRVNDDAVPHKLGALWNVSTYKAPIDFEGGNFMSDTKGNCFTSEGLLWYNGVGQSQMTQYFKDYLGCTNLYIMKTLANEGTTHIDMQMKLVDDDTVIVGEYGQNQDPQNYQITNQNAQTFQSLGYDVVRMPMPSNSDGNFRTYINSLFVNGVNMVPVYSIDKNKEAQAMAIWEQVMPDWTHVPMNSDDVIEWAGAIHCITMTTADASFSKMEADPGYACNGDWDCYPGNVTPDGCDGVSFEGCCDGNVLKYCENNQLKTVNCGNQPQCGWDSQNGFYNCGTNGGADPSGDNPKNCDGGCTPSCSGKECGSDGCGGSCGTCGANETCSNGQCVGGGTGCNGITYEGCCDGETLTYCENNQLETLNCAENPQCGWDSQGGFYNCGTNGAADPSGTNPKSCDGGCVPACSGKECGSDGCGGLCGTCGAGETCANGQCVCQPACSGKQCGPNGCGGTCGTCSTGFACNAQGQCVSNCTPDCSGVVCGDDGCGGSCGSCAAGEICQFGQCKAVEDPCLGINWEGCCEDAILHWCENGAIQTLECGTSGCGWNGDQGYYDCQFSGADPSGDNPLACPGTECIPNCAGKVCGPDGCGGTCGTCGANQVCTNGVCVGQTGCGDVTYAGYCDGDVLVWCENDSVHYADCSQLSGNYTCEFYAEGDGYYCVEQPACEPDCAGKACGDDGCGGSCGTCTGGLTCNAGQCVEGPCEPDCSGLECGSDGCGGSCGICPSGWKCEAGDCITTCQPNCAGKDCGDDGCGGTCGTCTGGLTCNAGLCVEGPCEPDCSGLQCGDDGCGGSCGACGDNQTCEAGLCVAVCQPDCAGKDCGADGCGGSCGVCPAGFSCQSNVCEQGCVPDCAGKECGDDGCGGLCGSCPDAEVCTGGQCAPDCQADCSGKECGPDGCGGSCGTCPKNFTCDAGACVSAPDGCGNVNSVGVCEGDTLKKCVSNEIVSIDCAATGKVCSFVPSAGVFDCVDQCIPNCAGKVCGDDGCGGSCGVCQKGFFCDAGQCQPADTPCTPACDDKQCGGDGCGGSCGTCAEGLTCNAGICGEETPIETDVIEDDTSDNPGADTGTNTGGKSSGGCSTTGSASPAAFLLLLALGLALAGTRRFALRR